MCEDHSGSEDEGDGAQANGDHDNPLAVLQTKLKELTTAYDLVLKNCQSMAKLASDLETSQSSKQGAGKPAENVALIKLTCSAMVKV